MKRKIKLLFTSVGRRVELIQCFKQAAQQLNMECIIYGADISETAPALMYCDKQEIVCRISNPNYIHTLKEICAREQIDALIPTIDTDLLLLAKNKREIEAVGTKVLISAPDKIAICRDKRYTADFFIECGLKSPLPVDDVNKYQNGFPCFIKPKDGSSSKNAFKVENQEALISYSRRISDYIIQPFIEGTEYTIDVFCDFDGKPIHITPRERMEVRAGEVLKTGIYQDDVMISECMTLIDKYKPCGPLTIQLIKEKSTGDNYYIEINPRFGGGAPLSIKAGADSAKAMLRLLSGESVSFQEKAASNGAVFSRFDNCVCICHGKGHKVKAVVFDLDDTLYSEKEYVRSGFSKVSEYLKDNVPDAQSQLWNAFCSGENAIDSVLKKNNIFSEELKAECVKIYRNHIPDIHLYDGVGEILKSLRDKGIKIGMITDGRPEGQRAKIKALKLEELIDEIIVTDELGGESFRKPDDISFRIMQKRLNVEFASMMYVGDNQNKDFIAPKQLGMQTCLLKNEDGLYFRADSFNKGINKITEIFDVLKI